MHPVWLQDVDTDPDPPNAELQISGVDSIVNGHLDNIPLEPPNPAVCVGNGFALEVTNDVWSPRCYLTIEGMCGEGAWQVDKAKVFLLAWCRSWLSTALRMVRCWQDL